MFTGGSILAWLVGLAAVYAGYLWDLHRLARKEQKDA